MKVFSGFLVGHAILFLACSCQHNAVTSGPKENEFSDGFKSEKLESAIDELEDIEKQIIYLEDESNLLKIRSKWVDAKLIATRSRRGELKLAKEMARYGALNERLPDESGFLKTSQRNNWNQKLHHKKNVSEKLFAISRLVERDFLEAKSEFARKHNTSELNASLDAVILD